MPNIKNLLIVGAGGIGSWLSQNLYESKKYNQIPYLNIFIADNDTVDNKNLPYQCFDKADLLDNKALNLALRFGFNAITRKIIDTKDLDNMDCIVSAVDNTVFRRLLFTYAIEHPDTYWIDLRSTGTAINFYTKTPKDTLKSLLATLPEQDIENSSCQFKYELENNIVQRGNKIIAAIGEQLVLNWYRGVKNQPNLQFNF